MKWFIYNKQFKKDDNNNKVMVDNNINKQYVYKLYDKRVISDFLTTSLDIGFKMFTWVIRMFTIEAYLIFCANFNSLFRYFYILINSK